MAKFVSIKTKLITNVMVMLSVIFLVVLFVVTVMNIVAVNKSIKKSETSIKNSIIAKGRTLAKNNSMALTGMVEDFAFTAIQSLVSSTVKDDDGILYGIYMDENAVPWVNSNPENPEGMPEKREPLVDSVSTWVNGLEEPAFKEYKKGDDLVFEFAAPVLVEDEVSGHIRYGLSTKAMIDLLEDARKDGASQRNKSIIILVLIFVVSIGAGYVIIQKMATKFTDPVNTLVKSATTIANGDYSVEVKAESNDEIGNLSNNFEEMRKTIKKYTEHLQDLVDEKMQEVNDILNNIDQGLFTINLDGSVNDGYSARANEILKVEDVASCSLNELLRFDPNQEESFNTWLNLVQAKHEKQRWKKLVKLSPVQDLELKLKEEDPMEYVSVSYQKIFDKNNKLSKIMVLAMDETEARNKDIQMKEEQRRHENEMKSILGIANTPEEEIAEFMEDSTERIEKIKTRAEGLLNSVIKQREDFPNGEEYTISKEHIDELYRDLHTIKGNGGSYGFELLSHFAHKGEDALELLKQPVETRRDFILKEMLGYVEEMEKLLDDIRAKIKLIFGDEEEVSVRVPETRINKIQDICVKVENSFIKGDIECLIDECNMLSWKPFNMLSRKYLKIAQKTARKVEKEIDFIIEDEHRLYPSDSLSDFDDALIHLVRNAVDHGIESREIRLEAGKGVGFIKMGLKIEDGMRKIKIEDDGQGIDIEKLTTVSIEKGEITAEEAEKMNDKEKMKLILKGGVSTADEVTDVSGRGVGMDVVIDKINKLGGSIDIDSEFGKGTIFTVSIPLKS